MFAEILCILFGHLNILGMCFSRNLGEIFQIYIYYIFRKPCMAKWYRVLTKVLLGIKASSLGFCNFERFCKLEAPRIMWFKKKVMDNSDCLIFHESHSLPQFYYSCRPSSFIYPRSFSQSQPVAYLNSLLAYVSWYLSLWATTCLFKPCCSSHIVMVLCSFFMFCIFEKCDNYTLFIHIENSAK